MRKTLIIAHRGVSEFAPENTLPAFEKAFEIGCDGIEFDVQLSKDGIPVIIHDETIDRTSFGIGNVKDFTLTELKALDFGIKFDDSFKNTTIPTLEEFLSLAKLKNFKGIINIELKNNILHYDQIEEKILSIIDKFQVQQQTLISSFNHESVIRVRELSSQIKVALLYDKNCSPVLDSLQKVNAYSANLEFGDVTKEIIENHLSHNFETFCYTPNTMEELKNLLDMGVGGVFTNNPELALKLRKQ